MIDAVDELSDVLEGESLIRSIRDPIDSNINLVVSDTENIDRATLDATVHNSSLIFGVVWTWVVVLLPKLGRPDLLNDEGAIPFEKVRAASGRTVSVERLSWLVG